MMNVLVGLFLCINQHTIRYSFTDSKDMIGPGKVKSSPVRGLTVDSSQLTDRAKFKVT